MKYIYCLDKGIIGENMTILPINMWERNFRSAAKNDCYDIFSDHLRFLDLPSKPFSMLKATILMVYAMAAYYQIDGRSSDDFLAMQTYNPAKSKDAAYMMTFDLNGHACARLLVDHEFKSIDLADLYNHPWHPYKTVGYSQVWISRRDWTDLTKKEMKTLEKLVTEDLLFDYDEDELDFWFNDSNPKYLYVNVQDHYELDDENEL
jgi:hypothetical protein